MQMWIFKCVLQVRHRNKLAPYAKALASVMERLHILAEDKSKERDEELRQQTRSDAKVTISHGRLGAYFLETSCSIRTFDKGARIFVQGGNVSLFHQEILPMVQ